MKAKKRKNETSLSQEDLGLNTRNKGPGDNLLSHD
jgi:hypothetical protein